MLQYRWHPLYGRELVVREVRYRNAHIFRYLTSEGRREVWRELPVWMFDPRRCSDMEQVEPPQVDFDALLKLDRLLRETRAVESDLEIGDRHQPGSKEVGVDERRRTPKASGEVSPG